ncbi:MAG: hypothetical protein JXR03_07490 [Cyclobacteriaceae bacterium]
MKKLFEKFAFALVAGSLILSVSCSEDEEPITALAPSVSAELHVNGSAATTAQPGDSVSFSLALTAAGGINRVVALQGGTTILDKSRNDLGLDAGETTGTVVGTITPWPAAADAGNTWKFDFVLVDELGQKSDTTSVSLEIVSPDAKVQTAILLQAPTGDGNSGTFYAIAENEVYTHSDVTGTAEAVSPNIDLGYYFGGEDEASLAAISNYPSAVFDISAWGTKNATKIIETTISLETYTALKTVADVEAEYAKVDFANEDGVTSLLAVGDILAFETVNELKGLIYVSALTEGAGSNGSITLEFILASE